MKKLLPVVGVIFLTLCFVSCPSVPDKITPTGIDIGYNPAVPDTESNYPLEQMGNRTASVYFAEEALYAGWNMGNTLDSWRSVNGVNTGGETYWITSTSVNQALMNGVKSAGFSIIRIPITWMGHIGDAPDHHISEARLVRVAEIVGMAHNAGLKVIINLHHDGTTSSTTEENGWLSISKACQSDDEYKKITHKFVRVWKQIAVYFKNYGDWLMFEAFNELHDGRWFWAGRNVPIEQYTLINEWNQLFTDTVRSTAANNASRYLVIPGYCTGPEALRSPNFRLPDDSASGRQVVSFHYYRPDAVGLNGTKSDWGTNADKNVVDNDFRPFQAAFTDKGIPVTIGEVGAVRQLYPSDPAKEAQARESRKNYLAHIYGTAKKYGLVPIYWDNGVFTGNGEKFGLFNRTTGQPQSSEFQECIDAMINAVK